MNTQGFKHLSLHQDILRALDEEGYDTPTPIQEAAIPVLLEGKDLLATAQTGTGKTAAFALPILEHLHARPAKGPARTRALILTPTRELALQIEDSLQRYGRHLQLRAAVILGGVPMRPQIRALRQNPDIIVATPGRLLDLRRQGHANLDRIEVLVLDEGDRMLDMGFIHDVRRIVNPLPKERQTMLFSATLTDGITSLAAGMLRDPSRVEVTPAASVSRNIEQKVLCVKRSDKRELLTGLLKDDTIKRALVFTRTKHGADRITRQLSKSGIAAAAIHSDRSQNARQRALAEFDHGRLRVLVATDIVARGIHVDDISHVINFEVPDDPESYVHRIGRTARAGAVGTALSFCDMDELPKLRGIEKLTQCPLTPDEDHPFHSSSIAYLLKRNGGTSGRNTRSGGQPRSRRSRRSLSAR